MSRESIFAVRNRAALGFDQRIQRGTFDGVTGAWSNLEQLGRMQIPYFAIVQPASGDFRVQFQPRDADDDPEAAEVSVLSIEYGRQRPAIGALTRFLDGSSLLGATTYTGGSRSTVVLAQPVQISALDVLVENAGADPVWVAAIGAWGNSLRFNMGGFREDTEGLGMVEFSPAGTPHANPRPQARSVPVGFRSFGEGPAFGIGRVLADLAWPDDWTIDNSDSSAGQTYTFASGSGTLLSKSGALTTGRRYRAAVHVTNTSDAALAVLIGGRERALTTGPNVIEAVADGGGLSLIVTAGTGYAGQVTLLALAEIEDPRPGDDATAIFETEADRPCLWIPRNEQAWRDRASRYGILVPGGSIQHVQGDLFDVSFRIREAR